MSEFGKPNKLGADGRHLAGDGHMLGEVGPWMVDPQAIAAEIARRWNAHEDLVQRLEDIKHEAQDFDPVCDSAEDFAQWVYDHARAALDGGE